MASGIRGSIGGQVILLCVPKRTNRVHFLLAYVQKCIQTQIEHVVYRNREIAIIVLTEPQNNKINAHASINTSINC